MQEGISAIIGRYFFQFKIISLSEDGKNLVLLLLKSKPEWNLKEVINDFSIKYSGINFHSWEEPS